MQECDIIEKWYKRLGFSSTYDSEFYAALGAFSAPIPPLADYDTSCGDGKRNLLSFLYYCEAAAARYAELGIPEDILLATLGDLRLWTDLWSAIKGELYLGELAWLRFHLDLALFKVGRLQFQLSSFGKDYPAHGIRAGEGALAVHIDSSAPLTDEACGRSFLLAKDFFATYFKDFSYSYFICHSWLLDEELEAVLKKESNILAFSRRFTKLEAHPSEAIVKYVFGWDKRRSMLPSLTPRTPFEERIMAHYRAGGEFHETLGFIRV